MNVAVEYLNNGCGKGHQNVGNKRNELRKIELFSVFQNYYGVYRHRRENIESRYPKIRTSDINSFCVCKEKSERDRNCRQNNAGITKSSYRMKNRSFFPFFIFHITQKELREMDNHYERHRIGNIIYEQQQMIGSTLSHKDKGQNVKG